MELRSSSVVTWLSIIVSLLAVFVIDQLIQPQNQFVAVPFAIPLLIAARNLPVRGIVATGIVVIVTASVAAHLDEAPLAPAVLEITGLLAIGYLGLLLARQREATMQRAYEAEVERARMRTIIDSAANAIAWVDARTGHLSANPQTQLLFGRELSSDGGNAQFVGFLRRRDGGLLSQIDLPSSRALRGEVIAQEEEIVVRPEGQVVPVLESAAPVHDPTGATIGAVVVFQDISALKELDRLREEWTSVIAHDLRQPITVMLGYIDLVQRVLKREGYLEPVSGAFEHLRASAVHQQKMVGDLLDVSRIEARHLTLHRREVDLPQMVQAIVQRSALVNAGHPVELDLKGVLPLVFVDPDRIEQVLSNLLSNAVKYSFPNTTIRIVLARRDAMVEVSVTNRGPGISPHELPKLFNRFYRTSEVRDGQVSGIGLGLYIARGLVEAHGGTIWAESIPGQETTFHFTVPV